MAVAQWAAVRDQAHTAAPETGAQARILDAVFECARRLGFGRTTMSDIARAAGLSRQTVYRYYPNKHALIAALVLREEGRLLEEIREAVTAEEHPRDAIRAGVLTTLRWLREHPLLDPVMASEPGELLPFLTLEAQPIVALGMRASEEIFRPLMPHVSRERLENATEIWSRLMLSYAMTPPTQPPETLAATVADLWWSGLDNGDSTAERREP